MRRRISASNSSMWDRPRSLAPYMATSESRSMSSARVPGSAWAMPMLAVMMLSRPPSTMGSDTAAETRSATSRASRSRPSAASAEAVATSNPGPPRAVTTTPALPGPAVEISPAVEHPIIGVSPAASLMPATSSARS